MGEEKRRYYVYRRRLLAGEEPPLAARPWKERSPYGDPAAPYTLEDVVIVPMRDTDAHLIYDSWCSNQAKVYHTQKVPQEIFKVEMRGRIKRLLEHCHVLVARPSRALCKRTGQPFDHTDVLSWICYAWDGRTRAPVIHFMATKREEQRRGLGGMLLAAAGMKDGQLWWATHMSRFGEAVINRYRGIYNPFLLEYVNLTAR